MKVQLINNETHVGIELQTWEHADHFAQRLRAFARGFVSAREQISPLVAMRREGQDVLIEVNNSAFALTPCAAALEISNGILSHSRKIEEELKASDIAFDQALLLRSGILPQIGLTNNKDIQELAGQEAAWNTILRKAISGGVRQQNHVGTPTVRKQNG